MLIKKNTKNKTWAYFRGGGAYFRDDILNVVKVGHKLLLPVGKNWNSFVKFRRLPGGHTCHIKRATCNILIFLRNIVILRKSGGEKVNIFLK